MLKMRTITMHTCTKSPLLFVIITLLSLFRCMASSVFVILLAFIILILDFLNFRCLSLLKSVQHSSDILMRPDVLAAVFFSAGMSFQRQVDSVNRLRMYSGIEDSLLPGKTSRLLLEDVSPTSRIKASRNSEVRH